MKKKLIWISVALVVLCLMFFWNYIVFFGLILFSGSSENEVESCTIVYNDSQIVLSMQYFNPGAFSSSYWKLYASKNGKQVLLFSQPNDQAIFQRMYSVDMSTVNVVFKVGGELDTLHIAVDDTFIEEHW